MKKTRKAAGRAIFLSKLLTTDMVFKKGHTLSLLGVYPFSKVVSVVNNGVISMGD
jgi:hypothetical protein